MTPEEEAELAALEKRDRREKELGGSTPKQTPPPRERTSLFPGLLAALEEKIPFAQQGIAAADAGYDWLIDDQDYGSAYDKRLANLNQRAQDFEEDHPYLDLATNAAAIPAFGAIGRAVKVLPYGAKLAGAIVPKFTDKTTWLGRMGVNALSSGLQGAISELGSDEENASMSRGAVTGALVGGLISPISDAAIGTVRGGYGKLFGPKLRGGKAEKIIASYADDIPTDEIEAGVSRLAQANREGVPLYPAEAMRSPRLKELSKRIAGNPDTVDEAARILEARASNTPSRLREQLNTVTPDLDPYLAGQDFKAAASAARNQLIDSRRQAVEGLYNQALSEAPGLSEKAILELSDDPKILEQVARLKNYRTFKDMELTDPKLLQAARRGLDVGINRAKKEAGKSSIDYEELIKSRKTVDGILKNEIPGIREADAAFQEMTGPLQQFDVLPIGNVKYPKTPGETLARVFMQAPAEEIRAARNFIGDDASKLAARSYLGGIINNARRARTGATGVDLATKLIESDADEAAIRAALGDDYGQKLVEALKREQEIFAGTKAYGIRSDTASNLSGVEEFLSKLRPLGTAGYQLATGSPLRAVGTVAAGLPRAYGALSSTGRNAKALRSIMIPGNPEESEAALRFIERLAPYFIERGAYNASTQSLKNAVTPGAARVATSWASAD